MSASLAIAGLSVTFPTTRGVFHALDIEALDVAPGEILGLVGESGSGKSTLALACLDLVPKPGLVTGSVRVAGREMLGGTGDRAGAAMIFQNPATALSPFFSIGRQMSDIVRRRRGLDARVTEAVCLAALDRVHLPDPPAQWRKYPHQLSGGQLQRVMIALALACQPSLLIADEPTTALDVTIQALIILLLRELAQSQGLAILFITHDLGVAAALCDRVAVLYAGRVVEEAPVAALFAAPRHPYSASLIAAVPVLGGSAANLAGIAGTPPGPGTERRGCDFAPRCPHAQAICRSAVPAFDGAVACHFPLGRPG